MSRVMDPVLLSEKIRAALAPCRLGRWPTPLEPFPALAGALGLAELRVKREDRAAPRGSGNKVRGLEFLLAGAIPGTVFVTVGGTGSTHCLATAVHARSLRCRAVLAQFSQPETPQARAVTAACAEAAALIVLARSPATLPVAALMAWRRAARLDGGAPRRWVPPGGADPRAVVGHCLAGLELAGQVSAPPDAIVLPLGTGGTAAGVLLALGTLGWPTRVVAVRVASRIVASRRRTLRLARRAASLLARRDIPMPRPAGGAPLEVVNGLGRGYGWPTPAGERARALASEHGLLLDPTYGAKAFAVLLQGAPCNVQRVVFWHTFAMPRPSEPAS